VGLKELLGRWAVRRAHVLVVEVPGAADVRMAVERGLTARSWVQATSPAEADVLAVCGSAGPRMSAVIAAVWDQMPGPRARVDVVAAAGVPAALEAAAVALLDADAHRSDATSRPASWTDTDDESDAGEETEEDPQSDGREGAGEASDGDKDTGEDHGDMNMDMPMPGGIGLAEGGQDRDGLEMDVLHVPLGPVLPQWPPGLVLTCTMQGDVVVQATAEVVDPVPGRGLPVTGDARRDVIVDRCDAVARLLAVAGWGSAAAQARRLRDDALDGAALPVCAAGVARLSRRITRSRVLRWSLRGLRTATRGPGGVGSADGPDVHAVELPDRLRGWLEEAAAAAVAPTGSLAGMEFTDVEFTDVGFSDVGFSDVGFSDAIPPVAVPQLVTGLDLAAVRLVVAGTGVVADLTASTAGTRGR